MTPSSLQNFKAGSSEMTEIPQQEAHVTPEPDYKVERPKPKMTKPQRLGMGALLAGASIAALWTIWPGGKAIPAVETSGVSEFQQEQGGSAFGAIEPAPEAKAKNGNGFADIEGELAAQRESLDILARFKNIFSNGPMIT